MCFRSHCVSLFGSFQKVTERSRMVVTIQRHIIWNTFNGQSAKIILDNIQCTSNFNMNIFSKSDAAIQTFLCLAKSDSLVFHLYILFGLTIGNVFTFLLHGLFLQSFLQLCNLNKPLNLLLWNAECIFCDCKFFFFIIIFYWVKLKICSSEFYHFYILEKPRIILVCRSDALLMDSAALNVCIT